MNEGCRDFGGGAQQPFRGERGKKVGAFRKLVVIEEGPFFSDGNVQCEQEKGSTQHNNLVVGPQRSKTRRQRETPYVRNTNIGGAKEGQQQQQQPPLVGGLFQRVRQIVAKIVPAGWMMIAGEENGGDVKGKRHANTTVEIRPRNVVLHEPINGFNLPDLDHRMGSSPVKRADSPEPNTPLSNSHNRQDVSFQEPQGILGNLLQRRQADVCKTTFTHLAQFFHSKGDQPMTEEEYEVVKELVQTTSAAKSIQKPITPAATVTSTPLFSERSRRVFGDSGASGPFYSTSLRRFTADSRHPKIQSKAIATNEMVQSVETTPAATRLSSQGIMAEGPLAKLLDAQKRSGVDRDLVNVEVETDEEMTTVQQGIAKSSSALSPPTESSPPKNLVGTTKKTTQPRRNTRTFSARFLDEQPIEVDEDEDSLKRLATTSSATEGQKPSERERILKAKEAASSAKAGSGFKAPPPLITTEDSIPKPKIALEKKSEDTLAVVEPPKLMFNFGHGISDRKEDGKTDQKPHTLSPGSDVGNHPLVKPAPLTFNFGNVDTVKATSSTTSNPVGASLPASLSFKFGDTTATSVAPSNKFGESTATTTSSSSTVAPAIKFGESTVTTSATLAIKFGEQTTAAVTNLGESSSTPVSTPSINFGEPLKTSTLPTFKIGGTAPSATTPSLFTFGETAVKPATEESTVEKVSLPIEETKPAKTQSDDKPTLTFGEAKPALPSFTLQSSTSDKPAFSLFPNPPSAAPTGFTFGTSAVAPQQPPTAAPTLAFGNLDKDGNTEKPAATPFAFGNLGKDNNVEKPATAPFAFGTGTTAATAQTNSTTPSFGFGAVRKQETSEDEEQKHSKKSNNMFQANSPFTFVSQPTQPPPVSIVSTNNNDEMMAEEPQQQQQPTATAPFTFQSPTASTTASSVFRFGSEQPSTQQPQQPSSPFFSFNAGNAFGQAAQQQQPQMQQPQQSLEQPQQQSPLFSFQFSLPQATATQPAANANAAPFGGAGGFTFGAANTPSFGATSSTAAPFGGNAFGAATTQPPPPAQPGFQMQPPAGEASGGFSMGQRRIAQPISRRRKM